ncbi:MAG: hypothetical protein WBP59_01935 [Ilumatobacteraceae bacterium]
MAWDNSRPVPWERLIRDWLVYAAIMTVVFVVFFRGDNMIGAIAGVLISGPLYLGFGAVLAKFGYTRKRFKELRAEAKEAPARTTQAESVDPEAPRPRPAPTSRTSGGTQRPKSSTKRKR